MAQGESEDPQHGSYIGVYLLRLVVTFPGCWESGYEVGPRSVIGDSTCVAVVPHAAAVKMEPVRVDQAIRSENGKDLLVINGFKFRFQEVAAESMKRWCCTNERCKCYIKCNASREIFVGDVRHNHGKDSEANLSRQILNNSVKRKAMESLCEGPRKLIHKELHGQDLNTNLPRHTKRVEEHSSCALVPTASSPAKCCGNSWSVKCCPGANNFKRTVFAC
jgi:hypothetical protein